MESNLESNMILVIKEISEFFFKFKCLDLKNYYANMEVSTCSSNYMDQEIRVNFYIDYRINIKSHSMGVGSADRHNWYGFFYHLNDEIQCKHTSELINGFINELESISKVGEA